MSKKNIQICFLISLIINAFLIGFIVAGPGKFGGPPPFPNPDKRLYDAAHHLPPSSKDKVLAILDEKTSKITQHHEQSFDGFGKIRAALTAPEMDMDKLNAAFESLGKQHDEHSVLMDDMLRTLAQSFENDQDRVRFFEEALPKEPPFPPPSKKDKKR